jgi:hypothetical protein
MNRYYHRKFLILLVALLLLLIAQPLIARWEYGRIVISILGSAMQVATILALFQDRKERVFALVFGLPTIAAIWSQHCYSGPALEVALIAGHAFVGTFLALTAVLVLHYVLTHQVNADTVFGALCAYLLIGVATAQAYFIMETLQPRSFKASADVTAEFVDPDTRAASLMYYSFTTLTTSGFGDIVPDTPLTRTLSWMEAVAGQFYLAVLVAGLVGMRVSQKMAASRNAAG